MDPSDITRDIIFPEDNGWTEDECGHLPANWPGDTRGIPSSILRSSLFGVIRRGRRHYLKDEVLVAWEGVTVQFLGERLDQTDLDVWAECLHRAQAQKGLGHPVYFSVKSFLEAIGRGTGGSCYLWLNKSLDRLMTCRVKIKVASKRDQQFKRIYRGSLVWDVAEQGEEFYVTLNPRLAILFEDNYTRLDWEVRLSLSGGLTRWLHGYICSHRATPINPHIISLDKLQPLCGVDTTRREFRRNLRKSMKELENKGEIKQWHLSKNDILQFVRPPAAELRRLREQRRTHHRTTNSS